MKTTCCGRGKPALCGQHCDPFHDNPDLGAVGNPFLGLSMPPLASFMCPWPSPSSCPPGSTLVPYVATDSGPNSLLYGRKYCSSSMAAATCVSRVSPGGAIFAQSNTSRCVAFLPFTLRVPAPLAILDSRCAPAPGCQCVCAGVTFSL